MVRAALLGLIACCGPALAADLSPLAATATNALGADLLRREPNGANVVLSPYSIQLALAMTFEGAGGETRAQMKKALHYGDADVGAAFAALNKSLASMQARSETNQSRGGDPIALHVASRLFGQKGIAFKKPFLELVADKFGATLEPLDFAKDPAGAAEIINAWVAKQTSDRIRNLIPENATGSLTGLVLANAIYLKAPWDAPFEKNGTQSQPFHLADGKSVSVPTMIKSADVGYAKREGFAAISLPYAGGELRLLILLPDAPDGLPALEKNLDGKTLSGFAQLQPTRAKIHLPKLKIEPPSLNLNDALQALGMTDAFDARSANFDGITPAGGPDALHISDVFHKAFLSLDEQGTEAAAATAVIMMFRSAPPPEAPLELRIDRPFLFAVQHTPSGACLFLGRVADPR